MALEAFPEAASFSMLDLGVGSGAILLAVLAEGSIGQVVRELEEHIKAQNEVIDFEGLVARQRASLLKRRLKPPKGDSKSNTA